MTDGVRGNGQQDQNNGAEPAPTRRGFLAIGIGGAAAATLAGCSDDDPAPPPVDAAPPPPAPVVALPEARFASARDVLSEPMLQNPASDSVRVVWFTEGEGGTHYVRAGDGFARRFEATSTRMSRLFEDSSSQVFQRITSGLSDPQQRPVFRHEAIVNGLTAGQRVPYVAITERADGAVRSGEYSLQPLPATGQPVKLLLSSDQQNNAMAIANYQKVEETVGRVDAVLFPGDFVSTPNRASEWFDRVALNNPSFFQSIQGTMRRWNPGAVYTGGEILQHAPLYGSLGNHEQPGRWQLDPTTNNPSNTGANNLNAMDNDPQPRWYAAARYEELKAQINPSGNAAFREQWIEDNSHEFITYREMWSLPEGPEGKAYWAQRFGDVFLISLDANRIWRTWNANQRGKFTEQVPSGTAQVTQNSDIWGFGDFTFRPFAKGSRQYAWLEQVLRSEAARTARFRVVLSHQTMAGLGDNAVPVLAEQRVTVELTDGRLIGPFPVSQWPARWAEVNQALGSNAVKYLRYEYPLGEDQWRTDIEPLLLENFVNLVHTGHSHLWNRTKTGSVNYLETANVGNSFGAMFFPTPQPGVSPTQGPRPNQPGNASWTNATVNGGPRTSLRWDPADYPTFGDPHGRQMIQPTLVNPMREFQGASQDLPFIASNVLTAFSILEAPSGVVSSYVFDTRDASSPVVKFDEFGIG